MAFLVIRPVDGKDVGGPVRPFQRIIREAGVIQGKLGMDRVMLLVDDSVKGISSDTGLGVIRFPTDSPDAIYDDVVAAIKFAFPPRARDTAAHDPIRSQVRDEALRVPWILVAVVVLAAIVPISLAFSRIFRDGDGDRANGAEAAATVDGNDNDNSTDGSPGGDGGEPGGGIFGGRGDTVVLDGVAERLDGFGGGLTASGGPAPAAPRVDISAGRELLPAICRIDTRGGQPLQEAIECDGAGEVVVDGWPGPWHNEIDAISMTDGVFGEVVMEPRADGTTVGPPIVNLKPGDVALNEADSRFGVQSITVRFSANGNKIRLHPRSRGIDPATLTFTLDR